MCTRDDEQRVCRGGYVHCMRRAKTDFEKKYKISGFDQEASSQTHFTEGCFSYDYDVDNRL